MTRLFSVWAVAVAAVCALGGTTEARTIIINGWTVTSITGAANVITLNAAAAAPLAPIAGLLTFSPGTPGVPYTIETLSNNLGYCWTGSPLDSFGDCGGTQITVQSVAKNKEGRVVDFIIYFGYSATSCPSETASLTVGSVTYTAVNPCALSPGLGGSDSIFGPQDTGALEFIDGMLVNPQNYIGHGWKVASGAPAIASPLSTEAVAVGPNAPGSSGGDPWVLRSPQSGGNYPVYHLEKGSWNKKPGAGVQLAVSPQGVPWLIDINGNVYYWSGTAFVSIAAPCATWVGVGPNAFGLKHGDPWILGCTVQGGANGYPIYRLVGANWVQQPGAGVKLSVSPQGIPWVIDSLGNVNYLYAGILFGAPAAACATSIAVGSSQTALPTMNLLGNVWITGCLADAKGNYPVYQLQADATWAPIPDPSNQSVQNGSVTQFGGVQIAVSPDLGIPWLYKADGSLYH
jgi:hypothetical protein